MALWIKEDKAKPFPRPSPIPDLRDGLLTVLSPGEAVPKLGISKLVEPSCSSHAEIAPDILIAAEIQLLHCARAGLEPLQRQTDIALGPKEKVNNAELGLGRLWEQLFVLQGGITTPGCV